MPRAVGDPAERENGGENPRVLHETEWLKATESFAILIRMPRAGERGGFTLAL